MPKRITPPNKKFQKPSPAPIGAADEAKAYRDDALARFAPADNLYDAIRFDVAAIGGVEIRPLERVYVREFPFNDIDWNPYSGE